MSHLKQGMYVRVGHLSDEEVKTLVDKFVEAGATWYEFRRDYRQKHYPYLLWDKDGDVWCSYNPFVYGGNQEVSVDFVLNGEENISDLRTTEIPIKEKKGGCQMGRTVYIDEESVKITRFAFKDCYGGDMSVSLNEHSKALVTLKDSGGDTYELYIKDVPKMIKALEAAYKEWGGENES